MKTKILALFSFLIAIQATADVTVPTSARNVWTGTNFRRNSLYLVDRIYLGDTTSNTMSVRAPELSVDGYTFYFPPADGTANQCLATDGSETTSWIDVVTPAGTQTLTNKTLTSPTLTSPSISGASIATSDVDGGTASDTSRLTIPKASSATLSGLTRKEATLVYDTTQQSLFVDDGTELKAIGAGDTSLNIDSVAADGTIVLKGGYISLANGKELASYDGAGTTDADFGDDISFDLDTLELAPSADTTYYLYIDLDTLASTATTTTDGGRKLYPITSTQLDILTSTPDTLDLSRYVALGTVRYATSSWSTTAFSSYSSKRNPRPSVNVSPVVYEDSFLISSLSGLTGTITHNANVPIADQEWFATYEGTDSSLQLENGWITNKTKDAVSYDFTGLETTDRITIKLKNTAITATTVPVSTYDSGFLSSAPTFPITHGLGVLPTAFVLQHEDGSSNVDTLVPSAFCNYTSTQVDCDLSDLTIDATHRVRIVASAGPSALAVNDEKETVTFSEQASAPTTPESGKRKLYAKDDGFYDLDDNGIETKIGSGSGGSEENHVTNPSAASDTTGWTSSTGSGLTRTTTAANLPSGTTTPHAFALTLSGDGDYAYTRFTLNAAQQNAANLLYRLAAKVADSNTWKLEIWENTASDYSGTATEIVLTTDSSGDTFLAATTAEFTTYWTPKTNSYIEARIVHEGVSSNTIYWSNTFIGRGSAAQGAYVGPWISWTPTNTQGFGTITDCTLEYRQNGESIDIRGGFTTGTVSAVEARVGLPESLTVGGGFSSGKLVGNAAASSTASADVYYVLVAKGNSYFNIGRLDPSSGTKNPLAGETAAGFVGNTTRVEFLATFPIDEWKGKGVSYLGSSTIEYAYNTSGLTTAGATDSSSFGYGEAGAEIGSIDSATASGSSTTTLDVKWKYPARPGDHIAIEVDSGTNGAAWVEIGNGNGSIASFLAQGAARYGLGYSMSDASGISVKFGNAGRLATSSTFAATGTVWSGISTWRWRAKKVAAGVASGFGKATATQWGLVAPYSTDSIVHSGTYTPSTGTGTGGYSGLTTRQHVYTRVGPVVTVSGEVTYTATSATTTLVLSLPIARSTTSSLDIKGGASWTNSNTSNVKISGTSGSSTEFTVTALSAGSGTQTVSYTFQYAL